MRFLQVLRLLFAVLLLLPLAVRGQGIPGAGCFGDDGFHVPCCMPVPNVNLPVFPSFQQDARYACFHNCNLESTFLVMVATTPTQILCDYAVISITVTPMIFAGPGWTGTLFAKYARTWTEPNVAGLPARQVWRFLVNGDLTPTSGASPCPMPPHPNQSTHFQGHMDYACDLNPLGPMFHMALSLHHLPGCISHHFLSAHPLPVPLSHPDRSYHLVSPGSTFAFIPVPVPTGPTPAEDVRASLFSALTPYVCTGEAAVVGGNLQDQFVNCLCLPGAIGPFGWVHQNLMGSVMCAGAVFPYSNFPLPPMLPPVPTGFVSEPIGSWTAPSSQFPSTRDLVIHWGVLQYQDPCQAAAFPFHAVSGVSTIGPPGVVFGGNVAAGATFSVFMDLGDKLLQNGLFGPFTLGWGGLYVSQIVWNLNLP